MYLYKRDHAASHRLDIRDRHDQEQQRGQAEGAKKNHDGPRSNAAWQGIHCRRREGERDM